MKKVLPISFIGKILFTIFLTFAGVNSSHAQCPPNFDLENGSFQNWLFYTGFPNDVNHQNFIHLEPTILDEPEKFIKYSVNPGDGLDHWGLFPKNCPNGSGHSAMLHVSCQEAASIEYRFTIPLTANRYNFIYYYAFVVENGYHHEWEQNRFKIEVEDLTEHNFDDCSQISYVTGDNFPGLTPSPLAPNYIFFKPWSAINVNLDNLAGHTISLRLTAAGCDKPEKFNAFPHQVWLYFDVASQCDKTFSTLPYCTSDTAINLIAPPGYAQYTWFDPNGIEAGNAQVLHLAPPPPAGSQYSVQVTANDYPYVIGCPALLTTTITTIPEVIANAGADIIQCNKKAVRIGAPPDPAAGVTYSWSPATGLSDAHAANPLADVTVSTRYILTVRSLGGGCMDRDTVDVTRVYLDNHITVIGGNTHCGDAVHTVLSVPHADSIQWFHEADPIDGATDTSYTVTESGYYYAQVFSNGGCSSYSTSIRVDVYPVPEAKFKVNEGTQCFATNEFIFTDTSSFASPALTYRWDFGDGHGAATKDATHSYTTSGTFTVKFTVSSGGGACTDEKTMTVTVKPGARADFSVEPVCVNLPLKIINKTLSPGAATVFYLWEFGNGDISTVKDPQYTFTTAGTKTIKLSTSTPECPLLSVKTVTVLIDTPAQGIRMPDQEAMINYPQTLSVRSFAKSAIWSPPTSLNDPYSLNPIFRGFGPQDYTIKLKTKTGCVTTDTLLVKTIRQIMISVPTGFTPNRDGRNDYLKPLLFGFKKVNYFRVYNRAGMLLYESQSDEPGWDGTYKGERQNTQTVVWILEAEDVDGKLHRAHGTTVVVR